VSQARLTQTDFKAKKIKVQLNQQIKSEQKQEHTEVLAAVDEDRKFVYHATIVRLMKSRKVSSWVLLFDIQIG
jgi:cullin 1